MKEPIELQWNLIKVRENLKHLREERCQKVGVKNYQIGQKTNQKISPTKSEPMTMKTTNELQGKVGPDLR